MDVRQGRGSEERGKRKVRRRSDLGTMMCAVAAQEHECCFFPFIRGRRGAAERGHVADGVAGGVEEVEASVAEEVESGAAPEC